jgi:hypothetical protein
MKAAVHMKLACCKGKGSNKYSMQHMMPWYHINKIQFATKSAALQYTTFDMLQNVIK